MGFRGTSSKHKLSPGERLAFPSLSPGERLAFLSLFPGERLAFPSELGIDPKDHEIRSLEASMAKMQQCHDEELDELERMRVEPWRA